MQMLLSLYCCSVKTSLLCSFHNFVAKMTVITRSIREEHTSKDSRMWLKHRNANSRCWRWCSSGGLRSLTLNSALILQRDQMTKSSSSHLFPACLVMDLGDGCAADWAVVWVDMADSAAEDKAVAADKNDRQKSFTESETPPSSVFLCLGIIDFSYSWPGKDKPTSSICHKLMVFRLMWRKPQLCDM